MHFQALLSISLAAVVSALPQPRVADVVATKVITISLPRSSSSTTVSSSISPSSIGSSLTNPSSSTTPNPSFTSVGTSSSVEIASSAGSSIFPSETFPPESSSLSSMFSTTIPTPTKIISTSASTSTKAAAPTCTPVLNVFHDFYGIPDNGPWGSLTSYDCGRKYIAGGSGTFDDPLTFASPAGAYKACEVIYDPYLQKYLRNEAICFNCSGKIKVWAGSATVDGGRDQIACENLLAARNQVLIRKPASNLKVDTSVIFSGKKGGKTTCNTRAVFPSYFYQDYCS